MNKDFRTAFTVQFPRADGMEPVVFLRQAGADFPNEILNVDDIHGVLSLSPPTVGKTVPRTAFTDKPYIAQAVLIMTEVKEANPGNSPRSPP
jgi:hypothetical protein